MGDKENDNELPELNITDDLHESEPSAEPAKTVEETEEVIPVVSTETEPTSHASSTAPVESAPSSFKDKLAAFLKTKKGKIVAVVAAALLLVSVLLAIPTTRYAIMGVFIKKDVTLTVLDSTSKKPVSSASVTLGTHTGQTDSKGKVTLAAVPVGEYQLKVEKKYYESSTSDYLVPILSAPADTQPQIKATGRTVTINVTNKITGACINGATVTVSGSSATSGETCDLELILPIQAAPQKGTVKAEGYNDATFEVTVTGAENQNVPVALTPSGKLFFLSKRTGKIDVMKSDLDGANPEVVVAGTGREEDGATVLLSTTDWKYLALLARRDSDKAKLYLVDAATGKLSTMDEGSVEFQLIGWSGHQFAYQVVRSQNLWADKRQALKSFNAETAKLATLDETQGSGSNYYDYASQTIANQYIVDGQVVYSKSWDLGSSVVGGDRKSSIMTVGVDAANKKSLKDFAASDVGYFEARLYAPGEIYYRVVARADGKASYYEYEDGKVAATADTDDAKFYNTFYATYLNSPSGNKTFWYEPRDGKNVIFVGDKNGNNAKEVGVSDYIPYGWYSDEYLLFSKKGSELYIFDADGKIDTSHSPYKVTDYHKPALTYPGYGGGYGGQ